VPSILDKRGQTLNYAALAARSLREPRHGGHGQGIAATEKDGEDQDTADKHTLSSNTSSNAAALPQTDTDHRRHIGADHPNDRTASDGFATDRPCLLICGFGLLTELRELSLQFRERAAAGAVTVPDHDRIR
jgi:hypothetical protein